MVVGTSEPIDQSDAGFLPFGESILLPAEVVHRQLRWHDLPPDVLLPTCYCLSNP